MKRYTRLQIIKHALQHYIQREGASEVDKAKEGKVLEHVEREVEELKVRYRINSKKNKVKV